MTRVFDEETGVVTPITVIEAGPCPVVQVKSADTDGYEAVQLAFEPVADRKLSRPKLGHLRRGQAGAHRHLVEFRGGSELTVGETVTVEAFEPGQRVKVSGVSKGHGFAGVMKRHGFGGLSAAHGTERKHRSPGAIGACATPSRVFKGMRMAGQMGNERVTVLNLEVVRADAERGLLLLRGAVPGPEGGLVMVRSATKTPAKKGGVR